MVSTGFPLAKLSFITEKRPLKTIVVGISSVSCSATPRSIDPMESPCPKGEVQREVLLEKEVQWLLRRNGKGVPLPEQADSFFFVDPDYLHQGANLLGCLCFCAESSPRVPNLFFFWMCISYWLHYYNKQRTKSTSNMYLFTISTVHYHENLTIYFLLRQQPSNLL